MDLLTFISRMSPFVIYGCYLNRKVFKQIAGTLIRRHRTRRLIWVCNVCLCSTKRMDMLTFISKMSPFAIIWVSDSILHFFFSNLNKKVFKQTMETLIRRRVPRRLIWVSVVCICSTKRTLSLYGLSMPNGVNAYRL